MQQKNKKKFIDDQYGSIQIFNYKTVSTNYFFKKIISLKATFFEVKFIETIKTLALTKPELWWFERIESVETDVGFFFLWKIEKTENGKLFFPFPELSEK